MNDQKHQLKSDQARSSDHKCEVSGSVHVGGEVEVEFLENLVKQYVAAHEEEHRESKGKYRLDMLTLIVAII